MKRLFLLFLISTFSYAGDKGNGGYSIVCRDNENGPITSAELLDIYEGRVLYKRNFQVDQNSVADLINLAKEKVASYGHFATKLDKEISLIERNTIYIPAGNELEPTDDAFPPIKKKGCKFEQLANYTNSGEVLISSEIYDELDNINKAALIIHEAIYSIRRKALGEKTSQNTRRLVAHLMSTNGDPAVIERWVYDSLHRPNNKRSCGLSGTLEEKIESCSYVETGKANFVLVKRDERLQEVWLDRMTKKMWSDRIPENMDFERALLACGTFAEELGDLGSYKWRLPTAEEYQYYGESLLYVLPNMTRYSESFWFWTSSTKGRTVKTYNGLDGQIGLNPFKGSNSGSVRCVAEL
jgi:hypothetical protein